MGLLRGEFDLLGVTFESIVDRIEAGDLTPILQISETPVSGHPSLVGVPLLGGPDGLLARRARERGEDPERALQLAAAVSQMFSLGRLVVAPPGLDPELRRCLSERLAEVVRDSSFVAAASRAQRQLAFEEVDALQSARHCLAIDPNRVMLRQKLSHLLFYVRLQFHRNLRAAGKVQVHPAL